MCLPVLVVMVVVQSNVKNSDRLLAQTVVMVVAVVT
jgi:hypothetical protein